MWSSGVLSSTSRAMPWARIQARRASVLSPNTTHSRSVYTDPHGGAGFGAGPTNRRRYSHTRSSSSMPCARPSFMSARQARASASPANGHSAAAASTSSAANAWNAAPASPVFGS